MISPLFIPATANEDPTTSATQLTNTDEESSSTSATTTASTTDASSTTVTIECETCVSCDAGLLSF